MGSLPSFRAAATKRNLWQLGLKAGYRMHVHGEERITVGPPMLVLVNDAGPLTAPITRAALPWPVHVVGADIEFSQPGIGAVLNAVNAITGGRSVAVNNAWIGAGSIALLTGVPMLAIRITGAQARIPTDPARLGSRIDVAFARPGRGLIMDGQPTAMHIRMAHERVRQYVADATPELESA
jgi:1-acyl-sn-glycerol-3-phosphate acyltransferase